MPYKKLTLVLIKIFEINATLVNVNKREKYFPTKKSDAKGGVKF